MGLETDLAKALRRVTVNPRKLEHGKRMLGAGVPYFIPQGYEGNDVPTFWLLLYRDQNSKGI